MQAMILAAGFGTRLLPHTAIRPKPLFPLLNKPLLELTIEQLLVSGCDRIVVNCHHLADQIEMAVAAYPEVVLQREESILGTGGGLKRALTQFRDEPILVTNGDIYHTLDYSRFYQYHLSHNFPVTMAMHHFPRFNSVYCSSDEVLGFSQEDHSKLLAFTGLHVIDPEVLEDIVDGFSCITERYKTLLQQNGKISCYRADLTDNFYWTDIGTPEDYLGLNGDLLLGAVPCVEVLEKPAGNTASKLDLRDVTITGWAAIGKAHLGEKCHISRSVIWDGVEVAPGEVVIDSVLSGAENG